MTSISTWIEYEFQYSIEMPSKVVKKMISRDGIFYFLTDDGELCKFNNDFSNYEEIHFTPDVKLKDFEFYEGKFFLVTTEKKIYAQEENGHLQEVVVKSSLQCPHGHTEEAALGFLQVAACDTHIFFVSEAGQLWGMGNSLPLGLSVSEGDSKLTELVQLDFLSTRKVLQVVVGHGFTIAMTQYQECSGTEPSPLNLCEECKNCTGNSDPDSLNTLDGSRCPLGLEVSSGVSGGDCDNESGIFNISSISTISEDDLDASDKLAWIANGFCSSGIDLSKETDEHQNEGNLSDSMPCQSDISSAYSALDLELNGEMKENNENATEDLRYDLKKGHEPEDFKTWCRRKTSMRQLGYSHRKSLSAGSLGMMRIPSHPPSQVLFEGKLKVGMNNFDQTHEVWSWGKGEEGQLGQGDYLARPQPCQITMLSKCGIVKVVCGKNHAVALSLDGKVYAWGDNSLGQLGKTQLRKVVSPVALPLPGSSVALDIAAGSYQTVVLLDEGKHLLFGNKSLTGDELEESWKELLPHADPECWHLALLAVDDVTLSCWVSQPEPCRTPLQSLYIDLLREFRTMVSVRSLIVNPMLGHEELMGRQPNHESCTKLLKMYKELMHLVSTSVTCLRVALFSKDPDLRYLDFVCDHASYIRKYKHYVKLLLDLEVCGGIIVDCMDLSSSHLLSNALKYLERYIPQLDEVEPQEAFQSLLYAPLNHFSLYCDAAMKLRGFLPPSMDRTLDLASSRWDKANRDALTKKTQTQQTVEFWKGCSDSICSELKTAERRLILDSRSCPLFLSNGGKFSSHWFLLMNDAFIHINGSVKHTHPLALIWVESTPSKKSLKLLMPETSLHLYCPNAQLMGKWLQGLQSAIQAVTKKHDDTSDDSSIRMTAPLVRNASYSFTKAPFAAATYSGTWIYGKMNGYGELRWKDGRLLRGFFRDGILDGPGAEEFPSPDGIITYEGEWKKGKMNGWGKIKYPNADLFEGNFKDGLQDGYGTMKQGQFLSYAASMYFGGWQHGLKHGYGVMDDIQTGEKYLGCWEKGIQQGPGILVTLDNVYYEGLFRNGKMNGKGLMIFEDKTSYEGEFTATGVLGGSGTLNQSNGDSLVGTFSGSWNQGIKISSAIYYKNMSSLTEKNSRDTSLPRAFGMRSIPAEEKWEPIFAHCCKTLGIMERSLEEDCARAWENLAIVLSRSKRKVIPLKDQSNASKSMFDNLEKIPIQESDPHMDWEKYIAIKSYLAKAFEIEEHPLGHMMGNLVEVFRGSYMGVGANPILLTHAVEEVKAMILRVYSIIRVLYPYLPFPDAPLHLSDGIQGTVTPVSLLQEFFLHRIYEPLFTLYAMLHENDDDIYWERLVKWNKQTDEALLNFLRVDHKFFRRREGSEIYASAGRNEHFTSAIDTLQQLGSAFFPQAKLQLLQSTFQAINEEVTERLDEDHLWSMDALFPVFQYVVVRARIRRLGSEIHLMEDLMEPHMQHGELGIMFTTLQACYFQIRNEELNM